MMDGATAAVSSRGATGVAGDGHPLNYFHHFDSQG